MHCTYQTIYIMPLMNEGKQKVQGYIFLFLIKTKLILTFREKKIKNKKIIILTQMKTPYLFLHSLLISQGTKRQFLGTFSVRFQYLLRNTHFELCLHRVVSYPLENSLCQIFHALLSDICCAGVSQPHNNHVSSPWLTNGDIQNS